MLTCTKNGQRRTVVWGGLANQDFGKWAAVRDNVLEFSAKDPVGRLVDAGQTYWAEDTFYLDVTTSDPFGALEQYGRAMRLANHANPNVYDFPVLCGWSVGNISKLPDVNNSTKLVDELEAAQKVGLACEVMKELAVPINDLCGLVAENQQKFPPHPLSEIPTPPQRVKLRPGEIQEPFNVHFKPAGYDQLAILVVASIEKFLPAVH